MILKLIGMIVLGILSALLSYYDKNYYVRVFNDILGREEDEKTAIRVGRGFFYGFFFPIYFVLLLAGVIFLIGFLIVAGIIAGIVFVLVWITEKVLPGESAGNVVIGLFEKIGLRGYSPAPKPVEATAEQGESDVASSGATPAEPEPPSSEASSPEASEKPSEDEPKG
jgi:hypothetical protein